MLPSMLPTPPISPRAGDERIGQILAGCIQLTDVLGLGAYGVVYKAVHISTGVQYAVKALNKVGLDARQRAFQQREIDLHHQVSQHPNIVSMVKVLDSPDCSFVILEFCSEGDLFSKITEQGSYLGKDQLVKSVFFQLLNAVEYCHSIGIYHRDLKPENVLVSDAGHTVKLADFGLATADYYSSDFGCGSTFYMSPECQQSNPLPYSCYMSGANDIWSLGVILVNLTCGRNPWKRASLDDPTFRAYMKDRNYLRTILPISEELDLVLRRIFDPNPALRISLQELRQLVYSCPTLTNVMPAANVLPVAPCGMYAPVYQLPAIDAECRPLAEDLVQQLSHMSAGSGGTAGYSDYEYSPPASPQAVGHANTQTQCNPAEPYFALPNASSWYNQLLPVLSMPRHTTMFPTRIF